MTTKLGTLLSILIALALGLLPSCSRKEESWDIVISNVSVIDGISTTRVNQTVKIRDGLIIKIMPYVSDQEFNTHSLVDGNGQFLIPGLWDMHVHFLYDERLKEVMPSMFLDHGITAVRDTGGDLESLLDLRADLMNSSEPSPDIFLSGPLLDGKFVIYDGNSPAQPELGTSTPPVDELGDFVKSMKEMGVDFIKLYELLDEERFYALSEKANQLDLPIASHVPLVLTADTAGPKANSMEHLRNIELSCASNWKELLQERRALIKGFDEGLGYDLRASIQALQRIPAIMDYDENRCDEVLSSLTSTIQVPTLRLNTVSITKPWEEKDWDSSFHKLPLPVKEEWSARINFLSNQTGSANQKFSEWSLFLISRLLKNNVPFAAGTDAPIGFGIPGYSLHNELKLLVESGATPQQAIKSATYTAASFFKLEGQVGQIQEGMKANLVLLREDPLVDIRNTREINRVMVDGKWARAS